MSQNFDIEELLRDPQLQERSTELETKLTDYIRYLLLHDFNKLVQLLYRVDVNEQKLRAAIEKSSDADAAVVIAQLLLERQKAKLTTRNQFRFNNSLPEDEKF